MGLKDDALTPGQGEDAPCFLSYKDADGAVRSAGPLTRERAEALVQVWGRMYPQQTCWVEPLPKEVEALHLGRVRRRRLTLSSPPKQDH
jgi:hypothetical protein